MLKTIFLNGLKLLVAGGLIFWLVRSGKLDFRLLADLGEHPFAVLTAVVLSITNHLLVTVRWRKILKARSERYLPFWGMVKVSWIGLFFSSVLPGSVSGDLVKMLYVQNLRPGLSKKFVFASILIDRVMGLSGLILLVGTTSLFFGSHIIESSPAMKPLLLVNFGLSLGVIVALVLFFFFHGFVRDIFSKIQSRFFPRLMESLIMLWDDITAIRRKLFKALALSLLVQFIGVLIFWSLIYPFVEGKMDFIQALAFIPLGLMTLALPVAPSGLGVGHAIFQKLFQFSGIDNGASLFNLYFFLTLLVNLAGVVPYLLSKRKSAN